jgi:hypothetical protein
MIISTPVLSVLAAALAGIILTLYIMRRRVRLGKRKGKF